jgi:pilus assembly protein CpaF
VRSELFERVVELDALADLDPAARRLALRSLLSDAGPEVEVGTLVEKLADRIDGFGPLSPLMRQPDVTDVIVNGPHEVWIERSGRLARSDACFDDADDLLAFVDRILANAGARVDAAHPIADGRLADGSRIHVVLPPIAPEGPLVSIRRFPERPLELDDLVARSTLRRAEADRLRAAVGERRSIAITGGTGTGKTTLLNALLGSIGDSERVVLVEEIPELAPPSNHFVRLVARAPNIEGRGEIGMPALVRAALRMRPDRIVVGEVRGGEAIVALDAMSTGHEGSMVTVHARGAGDVVDRFVALALQAGGGASEESLRHAAALAIDLVVHLQRDGELRRVSDISAPR